MNGLSVIGRSKNARARDDNFLFETAKSTDRIKGGDFQHVHLANLSHASSEKPVGVMPMR